MASLLDMQILRMTPPRQAPLGVGPRAVLALLSLFLLAGATPPPEGRSDVPSFDARLSSYDYPFDVGVRTVEAQRQRLEMAFMDLRPEEPNGRVVLLLHGKNFSGAYWERTARDLASRGYRVVMPDQIGFGKSSKPTNYQYSFAAMAHQTRALLDELGIGEAAVVGHSMGGMLAARFSLMYPERTTRLALVNPIGLEDWQAVVPYAPVDELLAGELAKTPERVRAYMQQSYFDGSWAPEYDALAELQVGWSVSPDREVLAYVAALTADMIFTQPVVHDFERISVPTLLLIGTRDRTALGKARVSEEVREALGRYDRLGRAAAAAIPGAELVELDGVGHVPQVEAYAEYISSLIRFLGASGPR